MPVLIERVEAGSHAARVGIRPGDTLVSIDGQEINDVLDYRFYMTAPRLTMLLLRGGKPVTAVIEKEEYDDPGLLFETYLMDRQRSCKNKCIFCFIDQMPAGMRDTLYFKDDDSRMSFLFGNYITLTNLTDKDIDRIIAMHISPVNISVHTTDPELRIQMMKNPRAGESLRYLERLTKAGIAVNTQLVLVPGWNDGAALGKTLADLEALTPELQSIACVPVGLTKFRQGLPALSAFDPAGARETIERIHRFADRMEGKYGRRIAYPSDEFFLRAGMEIPDGEYYGDFEQLENGVGLIALLREDFRSALADDGGCNPPAAEYTIATGVAAAPLLQELAGLVTRRYPQRRLRVQPVVNRFFGETITVAGLVTGVDLAEQLAGQPLGQKVLLPAVMLRRERDRFLDDMTPEELEKRLGVPVQTIENDGWALYEALAGIQEGTE